MELNNPVRVVTTFLTFTIHVHVSYSFLRLLFHCLGTRLRGVIYFQFWEVAKGVTTRCYQ